MITIATRTHAGSEWLQGAFGMPQCGDAARRTRVLVPTDVRLSGSLAWSPPT